MLTAEALAGIPGVTPGDSPDPETLCFSVEVRSHDPVTDGVISLTLDVRCPLDRGRRPLLDNPRTRVERRGGGAVPSDWRADNLRVQLERRLARAGESAATEQRRRERLNDAARVESARESSRAALALATEQFFLARPGNAPPSAAALPDFLSRCAEAFLAALSKPVPPHNPPPSSN